MIKSGRLPVSMCDFPAADESPAADCIARVTQCSLYVGLIGFRYGSPVRDRPDISYTELEFDAATAANIPRLVFLLDEKAEVPAELVIDLQNGNRQATFRRELENSGLVIRRFTSADNLETAVLHAIGQLNFNHTMRALERSSRLSWIVPESIGAVTERPQLSVLLVAALIAPGTSPVALSTTLEGAGGFGKTTLAAHVCRTKPAVAERFPGGLLWVTVGEKLAAADLTIKVNNLCEVLSGKPSTISDPGLAGARLGELLDAHPPILLVLDDVWNRAQLEPFLIGGKNCRRLITTRNSGLLPGSTSITVDAMAYNEAASTLTAELPDLPDSAIGQLLPLTGRWPVLLGLVNAALVEYQHQGASLTRAVDWVIDRLEANGPAALDVDSSDSRGNAVAATLEASLKLLSSVERERYLELGIFPEDVDIPHHILRVLWSEAGLDHGGCDQLRDKLVRLRLALGAWIADSPAVRLHDVIRSYLRYQWGSAMLVAGNRALIRVCSAQLPKDDASGHSAWWHIPERLDYLWKYLTYHLSEALLLDEVVTLVEDLRWVIAKIEKYGPIAIEPDLALAETPVAMALKEAISESAHLLTPLQPGLADTLLSRLHGIDIMGPAVARFSGHRDEPRLSPRWPLFDRESEAGCGAYDGHIGGVRSCAIASDGSWLVSASADATVRLWNAATGEPTHILKGHVGGVACCAVAADSSWLASAGADGIVRIWDAATGGLRHTLTGHADRVNGCAIAPDGSWLASASTDGSVRIWDAATGGLRHTLTGHADRVNGCAIAPDGSWLASADARGNIRMWDAATGELRRALTGHADRVDGCAVAPDGSWLASASADGTVRIWDAATGELLQTLTGHTHAVTACAIAPDGSWLASAGTDGTVRIWDTATGELLRTLTGHTGPVRGCAVAPDGSWLASASADGTVRIWDAATGVLRHVLAGHNDRGYGCAVAPDGGWLASAGADGTVRMWDAATGELLQTLTGHTHAVTACAIAPDGSWLASAGTDGTVRTWDASTGELLKTLTGHTGRVDGCAIAPDGSWLASAGADGTVRIWDAATGGLRATLTGHAARVNECAIAPDGSWLASVDSKGNIRMWDAVTGELRRTLIGPGDRVYGCAIAPDGSWLASAGADGTVRIWDVATGQLRHTLTGNADRVRGCAVAANGTRLASAGTDGTVRIWDTATCRPQAAIRVDGPVNHCAWTSASNALFAVGGAGVYMFDYYDSTNKTNASARELR